MKPLVYLALILILPILAFYPAGVVAQSPVQDAGITTVQIAEKPPVDSETTLFEASRIVRPPSCSLDAAAFTPDAYTPLLAAIIADQSLSLPGAANYQFCALPASATWRQNRRYERCKEDLKDQCEGGRLQSCTNKHGDKVAACDVSKYCPEGSSARQVEAGPNPDL